MDNSFENIVPWNGANDTGKDVRLKWLRNFAKIGLNFEEIGSKLTTVDDLFEIIAEELEKRLHTDKADTAEKIITFLEGMVSNGLIEAKGGVKLPSGAALYSKYEDNTLSFALDENGFVIYEKGTTNKWSVITHAGAEFQNLVIKFLAKITDLEVSNQTTTLNLLVQELAKTYDLDVSNVATLFRTIVKDYVSSETFISGITGEGMKLYKALNGDWNLELDNVTIRKAMTIFELIISKIRSVNGGLVVSQGNGRIKSVAETTGMPAYYVLGIEGDMTFEADDFVRCQVFSTTGAKYYWVRVDSISGNSIVIPKSEFPEGTVPTVGDDLVQMGNKTNTARQGVLYLTASEDGKPRFSVLDGVDSTDLTGKNKVILGCLDGITDSDFPSDQQPHGYGLWAANVFLKGLFILRNGKSIEDELNDQITAVKTAFEIREGQISTKVQAATTAAAQASGSASAAAGSASNAAKSASQASGALVAVTQKETNINQTASDIDLKATRAESAAGRAESAEAGINLKADGVVVQAASSAAQAAIDGVIVGGRNLLKGTKDFSGAINNQGNVITDTYKGLSIAYFNNTNAATYVDVCQWVASIAPEANTQYTLSFYAKGSANIYSYFYPSCVISGKSSTGVVTTSSDGSIVTQLTQEWTRYWITWKTLPGITGTRNIIPARIVYQIADCYICGVKFEIGNKATDWSAAQEDITADYTAKLQVLSNQISSKVSQTDFNSLKGTVTNHTSTINQLPTTIDQRITSQTQNGGIIKTKVESWFTLSGNTLSLGAKSVNITGATVFSSLATNDSVTNAINNIEVGGTNYYSNKNTPVSPLYGSPHIEKDVGVCPNGLYLIGTAADSAIRISEVIKSNGWYTISFDLRGSQSTSSGFNVDICDNYIGVVSVTPDNNWVHHTLTGYVGNYSPTVYNFIDFEHLPWAYIFIRNIKVEKGNKATDWSPAPEDVTTDATIKANLALTSARDNVALRLGYANYATMEAQAIAGNTIINGGKIRTSLIDADAIITNSLLASKIAATDITTGRLTVTTGAKIGGWNVDGNALTINSALNAKLKVELSGTQFLRINDDVNTLLQVRNDGDYKECIRLYTFGNAKALFIRADSINEDGRAIESYGNHSFTARPGERNYLGGSTLMEGLNLISRNISSSQSLTLEDTMIITTKDGSDLTLTLPINAYQGKIYFIRKNGTSRVWVTGDYIINDGDWIRERSTRVDLNGACLAIFMYNGTYWTFNSMNG